jgi:putative aldouronate transport system permease protein
VAFVVIFNYLPMSFLVVAFKRYSFRGGIFGSPWVGLKEFRDFFGSPMFPIVLRNTVKIGAYGFIAGTAVTLVLAFTMNEVKNRLFKKSAQMITYAPYFISSVVVIGMITNFLNLNNGIVNTIITDLGGERINFMGTPGYFIHIFIWSGIWQSAGYGSVIYLSALSSIDSSLVEAAIIDGATRFQRLVHIDIPGIAPTIALMLILSTPALISVPFDRILLFQNPIILSTSEVVQTYIYKQGVQNTNFAYSTAVGLCVSVASLVLVLASNYLSGKIRGERSLF